MKFNKLNYFNVIKDNRFIIIISVFSMLVAIFHASESNRTDDYFNQLLRENARTTIQKDISLRKWVASHGGVYVPITLQTPPNKNLSHIKNRDITTTSGKQLTLMNPAYVVRQVTTNYKKEYGVLGHLVGFKPRRKETTPDNWEKDVLDKLKNDEITEYYGPNVINGKNYMRLIYKLNANQRCLKCHEYQGYKIGDMIGGLSVALPFDTLKKDKDKADLLAYVEHITLWILGVLFLFVIMYRTISSEQHAKELSKFPEENNSPVIRVRHDQNILFSNKAAAEILKKDQTYEELLGKHKDFLKHPDKIKSYELSHNKKIYNLEFVKIENQNYVNIYGSDITESKNKQKEIEYLLETVQHYNDELKALLYTASHDFRTPLVNFEGFFGEIDIKVRDILSKMKMSHDPKSFNEEIDNFLTDELVGYENLISRNVAEMSAIIEGVMSVAKIGGHNTQSEDIDMNSLINNIVTSCYNSSGELKDQFECNVSTLHDINADPFIIKSIFTNLISNAVKFRSSQRDLKVQINSKVLHNKIVYSIKDNGVGLCNTEKDKIFNHFYRSPKNRMTQGAGLGLSIVKWACLRINGSITVDSTENKETVFHISIPT